MKPDSQNASPQTKRIPKPVPPEPLTLIIRDEADTSWPASQKEPYEFPKRKKS